MTQQDIVKYFTAEKNESWIFMAIGVIAIGVACYGLFINKTDFYKGMSFPLLLIAAIQILVGGTVFFRSPKDIARVTAQFEGKQEQLKTAEWPRMETVKKNFVIYRYTEMALAIAGILIAVFLCKNNYWLGFGVALTVQSVLMLVADYFAEKRALVYSDLLKQYLLHLTP